MNLGFEYRAQIEGLGEGGWWISQQFSRLITALNILSSATTAPSAPSVTVTGGVLLHATLALTDAQIKRLPTTGVLMVGAPGPGMRVKILAVSLSLNTLGGAYTNIDATYADWHFENAGGDYVVFPLLVRNATTTTPITQLQTSLGSVLQQIVDVNPVPMVTECEAAGTESVIINNSLATAGGATRNWENSAITFHMDNNGSGNLTGGHAANSLKVSTYYVVETV